MWTGLNPTDAPAGAQLLATPLPNLCNLAKKFSGSQHRQSPKRVERQEVMVAGDDVGRPATHGEFKELVIAGVAALVDLHINLDPLRCPGKDGEKLPRFIFGNVGAELASGENFLQFSQGRQ